MSSRVIWKLSRGRRDAQRRGDPAASGHALLQHDLTAGVVEVEEAVLGAFIGDGEAAEVAPEAAAGCDVADDQFREKAGPGKIGWQIGFGHGRSLCGGRGRCQKAGRAAPRDTRARPTLWQYESIAFAEAHKPILHLLPAEPARVLDIGAGTGRDAAGFAALGHRVVAVEPTAAMRAHGMRLHPSPAIEWVDDSLPELAVLSARGETFDVVMLTAVWMHLDEAQRERAMPQVAALVRGWADGPVAAAWAGAGGAADVRGERG